jgi:hypothetical protein
LAMRSTIAMAPAAKKAEKNATAKICRAESLYIANFSLEWWLMKAPSNCLAIEMLPRRASLRDSGGQVASVSSNLELSGPAIKSEKSQTKPSC